MFNTLKRLFKSGLIDEIGLGKAVNKGWITEQKKQEIMLH